MKYSIIQESRKGGRNINQDRVAWLATDAAVLMVVADGMGGHLQGEIAAQLAVNTVSECFTREARPRLENPATFLGSALHHAHESIVRYAAECKIPLHAAPRTTCIACVVQDGQANWAHAGDSRLYLVHAHEVLHTRDHSLVQRMVDEGTISPDQAARHPLRNRVFSCLGGNAEPQIDVSERTPLREGDLIALCTDGAWSPLGDAMATELLRNPLTTTVPGILDAAERAAGADADNLTLIAMRWHGVEQAVASDCHEMPNSNPHFSNEDIERAVAEIRRRTPYSPAGVHQ